MGSLRDHQLTLTRRYRALWAGGMENNPLIVHAALILVQIGYSSYHVVAKLALAGGVSQIVFCTYRDLVALMALAPAAYLIDREKRLPLNRSLILSFILLGVTGVFGNQLLFMFGLNYTSPAYAGALQPSIPVFTFVLAVALKTETVDLGRWDGFAKFLGVVVCASGAVTIAIYKGAPILGDGFSDISTSLHVDKGSPRLEGIFLLLGYLGIDVWHMGILCLIGNCICFSVYLALQSRLLVKYPAATSMTAFSYLFGAALMIFTGIISVPDMAEWVLDSQELAAVLFAGIVPSALNYGLITWCNKHVGPAVVASYLPIQPLASTLLTYVFLGSTVYFGSLLGGALILTGLYMVVWGKNESNRIEQPVYKKFSSRRQGKHSMLGKNESSDDDDGDAGLESGPGEDLLGIGGQHFSGMTSTKLYSQSMGVISTASGLPLSVPKNYK